MKQNRIRINPPVEVLDPACLWNWILYCVFSALKAIQWKFLDAMGKTLQVHLCVIKLFSYTFGLR